MARKLGWFSAAGSAAAGVPGGPGAYSWHRRSDLYRHGAVSLRQNPPPAFMRLVPGATQSLVIQEQQQITRLQRVLRRSASAQSQRKGAVAPCSSTPQESQIERCEHQDDSNIHCQPFPESVSEKHEIYTDYDGCHRHHVKHASYLSAHFSPWFNRNSNQAQERIPGRTPGAPDIKTPSSAGAKPMLRSTLTPWPPFDGNLTPITSY